MVHEVPSLIKVKRLTLYNRRDSSRLGNLRCEIGSAFDVGQLVGHILADPKLSELVMIWRSLSVLEREGMLNDLRARVH
jgi:hypothetical protein